MKIRLCPTGFALVLSFSLCLLDNSRAQSLTNFNTDIIRARGIPASVATYFQTSARFLPGVNHPTLVVNGNSRGTLSVNFSDQGTLCADERFLKAAGILTQQPDSRVSDQNNLCPSLPASIEAKLQPGRNRIELLVPPQLLDNRESEPLYVSGGRASLLNYSLFAVSNHTPRYTSQTFYGSTESGFNFDNWVIRSHDLYSGQGNQAQFKHQSAWIKRTFPDIKSTLQAGQLYLNSPLFSAPSFNGFQLMPETALIKTDNGIRVSGIAPSAARVEVRQGGTLIYSTLVPPGHFVLENLPLISLSQDLEVSVIENTGEQRRFIVPATSFATNFMPVQRRWTFAAGKHRDTGYGTTDLNSNGFITATATLPVRALQSNMTAGILAAQHYTSAGLNASTQLWKHSSSYLRLLVARDARTGTQGTVTQAGHNMLLSENLSGDVSAAFYSAGFRHLTDRPRSDASRRSLQKRLYSTKLEWNNEVLGAFSFGLTRTERFDGSAENYPVINWSRSFGNANVSLTMEPHSGQRDENRYYLNISLPLGRAYASFSATQEGRYTRASLNASQQVNEYVSYSLGTSTLDNRFRRYGFNGSLNLRPLYTSLYAGYSYNGHNSHSWSGSMNGGVVYDGQGLLFSPQSVSDTFGIVSLPELPGAKIQTPAGTVWINGSGRAAVPSITPYQRSHVELVTHGLPRNVEVRNALSVTEAGRGSVSRVSLKAERHRKILLQVTRPDGKIFPQGMAVLDARGNYLSITGSDSDIYLAAEHTGNGVVIEDDNGQRCTLDFILNSLPPKDDAPYETIPAICR